MDDLNYSISIAEKTRKIQNIDDFKQLIENVKSMNNGKLRGKCPAGNHRKQENEGDRPFEFYMTSTEDGQKINFDCFAGCSGEEILQSLNLEWQDIYLNEKNQKNKPDKSGKLTVEKLASQKGFEPGYLKMLGLENLEEGSVKIPYRTMYGDPAARYRRRFTNGKYWNADSNAKTLLYGLERLQEYDDEKIVFVEGETDCLTLWRFDIPALGLPGNTMQNKIRKSYIEKFEKIYIWQEHGNSGKTFVERTRKKLAELDFEGAVFILYDEQFDDPNNILQEYKEDFLNYWQKIVERAKKVELSEEKSGDLKVTTESDLKNLEKTEKGVLKKVSEIYDLKVEKFIKYNSDPTEYELETAEGSALLGDSLLSQRIFRRKVMNGTGKIVPKLESDKHEKVIQLLLNIAETRSLGEGATDAGAVREWLIDYLKMKVIFVPKEKDQAATTKYPYQDEDNRICIFMEGFRRWLQVNPMERIDRKKLGTMLRRAELEPDVENFKIKEKNQWTTRSVWRLPRSLSKQHLNN